MTDTTRTFNPHAALLRCALCLLVGGWLLPHGVSRAGRLCQEAASQWDAQSRHFEAAALARALAVLGQILNRPESAANLGATILSGAFVVGAAVGLRGGLASAVAKLTTTAPRRPRLVPGAGRT